MNAAPTKILLLDDDSSFRSMLSIRLRSFLTNCQFDQFGCVRTLRETLPSKDVDYDLVILDEHLPDGKGLDLLKDGYFQEVAVLSVSSDESPDIPGRAVLAGAGFFLSKAHVSLPLFQPLILGLIDRNRINRQLREAKLAAAQLETVKTLTNTLQHEINNPLGAVMGAAYLLSVSSQATEDQRHAAHLVQESGQRIKHVLDNLCKAFAEGAVKKANQAVYHIPGDKKWE